MNNLLICIEEKRQEMYTNSKILPLTHPYIIRISQEIDLLLNQLADGGIRKNESTSKKNFTNKQSYV
ncbi:aspartyl-phosphate phosphatase Spo0E family protein [Cytobacillus purgationiresistens]|uniref:Aspartyl-phosphate phosphatase Spo0E family protein n=1 Tax=Cytobacillus purgationiresistens TaxID=863449 RepID=A0ABU0ARF6_9BACI|nr:aspartyl-phosphate phosphatase Spo0E family protein [Cytobacillus purgationiresistens]MDQ0273351.1 hypothetical protein [Cytobacillus purgationiresistens]